MRLRSTLLLLVLLLGLGGYVYWVEMPRAEQEARKKTLFDLKTEDVSEVDLAFADREIHLSRSGEGWRITKPLDVAADPFTVKSLVSAVAECEIKKEMKEAGSDLAAYGLDKPFVTVRIRARDRELPAFAVGKNTPVGGNTYLQKLDDKQLMIAGSSLRSGLDKKVAELRDKTILSFAEPDVQGIALVGSEAELKLARSQDKWQIEKPAPFAADPATIRSFLSTLRTMRAVDFPPAEAGAARYGLDKPRLRIALSLGKDKPEHTLVIGAENPEKKTEIYVQGGDTIYTVADWVWRDLNKSPADFRDKTVLAFDRSKLTTVEIRRPDGTATRLVGGDAAGWKPEGVEGTPATTNINQWIGDLAELKGSEVADENPTSLAPYGLDTPILSIQLAGEGGASLGSVLVGEHKTDQGSKEYFGKSSARSTVYKLRDYSVTRLNKQGTDFIAPPTPTPGGPAMKAPPPELGEALGMGGEDVELDAEDE